MEAGHLYVIGRVYITYDPGCDFARDQDLAGSQLFVDGAVLSSFGPFCCRTHNTFRRKVTFRSTAYRDSFGTLEY